MKPHRFEMALPLNRGELFCCACFQSILSYYANCPRIESNLHQLNQFRQLWPEKRVWMEESREEKRKEKDFIDESPSIFGMNVDMCVLKTA